MRKILCQIMFGSMLMVLCESYSYGVSLVATLTGFDFSHVSKDVVEAVKKGGVSMNVIYPGQWQGTLFSNYWSRFTGATLRSIPQGGVTLEFWIWTDKEQEEIKNAVTKVVVKNWNPANQTIQLKVGNTELGTDKGYVSAILRFTRYLW